MQRDENRAEIFGPFWKKIWKQSTDIEAKTEIQGREAEMAKISRGNRNATVISCGTSSATVFSVSPQVRKFLFIWLYSQALSPLASPRWPP
jgi:hypothetical protein